MPKASQWRKIFSKPGKWKRRVRLDDKSYAEMTKTQAHRFEQLSQSGRFDSRLNDDDEQTERTHPDDAF